MPELFQWKPEFTVAVERFDREHKKLFSMLNELNDAMRAGQARFVVGRVLHELLNYTRTHFAAEVAAMRRTGYAGIEEHIAEHEALAAKVEAFVKDYEAGNTNLVSIDLLYFMHDWLEKHILQTDQKYSRTLNEAGIR
jgi:hemerythrin-like metal-binding protein